jgi:hypothetical protein
MVDDGEIGVYEFDFPAIFGLDENEHLRQKIEDKHFRNTRPRFVVRNQ